MSDPIIVSEKALDGGSILGVYLDGMNPKYVKGLPNYGPGKWAWIMGREKGGRPVLSMIYGFLNRHYRDMLPINDATDRFILDYLAHRAASDPLAYRSIIDQLPKRRAA